MPKVRQLESGRSSRSWLGGVLGNDLWAWVEMGCPNSPPTALSVFLASYAEGDLEREGFMDEKESHTMWEMLAVPNLPKAWFQC